MNTASSCIRLSRRQKAKSSKINRRKCLFIHSARVDGYYIIYLFIFLTFSSFYSSSDSFPSLTTPLNYRRSGYIHARQIQSSTHSATFFFLFLNWPAKRARSPFPISPPLKINRFSFFGCQIIFFNNNNNKKRLFFFVVFAYFSFHVDRAESLAVPFSFRSKQRKIK